MLERQKEEKRESREEERKENITILWSAMYIFIIFKPIITMGQSGFGQAEFRKHLKKKTLQLNY